MIRILSALGAVALVAACATTPVENGGETADNAEGQRRDCFSARSVRGFSGVDRDTVILNVSANRRYEVDVYGAGCRDLDWSQEVALRTPGSSFICVGDGPYSAQIITGPYDICRIKAVRRVVEEEDGEESEDPADDGADDGEATES